MLFIALIYQCFTCDLLSLSWIHEGTYFPYNPSSSSDLSEKYSQIYNDTHHRTVELIASKQIYRDLAPVFAIHIAIYHLLA